MSEELKAKDNEILELFKMCNEKDNEIERLNKENSDLQNIANIETSKNEYLEKEIERLNKENKELNKVCARKSRYIDKKDLEIGRLNNIIKKANEKIHNIWFNVSSKEHNLYLKLDETYQGKELLALLEIEGVDK